MRARITGSPLWPWAPAIALVALMVRLPFLFGHHVPPPDSDNEYFFTLAASIRAGDGIEGAFWTPGYPAFIALLALLPGRDADVVTIAQHLLGVGLAVAVFWSALRWWGRAAALMAAGIAAIAPIMVMHEHTLLPDFLFGLLVLVGAIALAEACSRADGRTWTMLVLAGLMFGLATWVKPAGQFLFFAAPLPLLFSTRAWRPALLGALTVAGVMLAVMVPWLVRNTSEVGFPTMSVQGGATLSSRAFETSHLPIPPGQRHSALARSVRARIEAGSGERFHSAFHKALIARGAGDSDAWVEQRRMASAAILRSPGPYLSDSAGLLWSRLSYVGRFEGAGGLLDELDRTDPPYPTAATRGLWDFARVAVTAWWIACLHGLAGLLVLVLGDRRSRTAGAALLSVWLAVMLGTVLTHGGLWRYAIQVAPLAWILGSAGVALLARELAIRLRGARPRAGSPA